MTVHAFPAHRARRTPGSLERIARREWEILAAELENLLTENRRIQDEVQALQGVEL